MNKKIKILIAQNNQKDCNLIADALYNQDIFNIVHITTNGKEALNKTLELNPDVAIIDSILSPIDGLGILEELSEQQAQIPKIIMISGIAQETLINNVMTLGAEHFLLKPTNPTVLRDRIIGLFKNNEPNHLAQSTYKTKNNIGESDNFNTLTHNSNPKIDLQLHISEILLQAGIPASIKGYNYLREAITLAYTDLNVITGITKILYPAVAEKFNSTPSKVERAIRHSIEVAWKRNSSEYLEKIFHFKDTPKKPTNGEFISTIADNLRLQQKIY